MAIFRGPVLRDAEDSSSVLCTIFPVAKRGERCCIGRLLRPPTLRGRGTPKWPFFTKSLFSLSLRSEDPRSQDPGSGPIELVLSDAGESVGDLGTIFRVTSRLERWCIARLMRPPHLGERDPKKRPKNAPKGIVQGAFSAILRVLVLSYAGVLSTVLCAIF